MVVDRIALSKEMHPESLERLCVSALASGDPEAAFMYADRRCRIHPLARAHHFTLRAETLMRRGDREGALDDVRTALALAPDDIQANRRMLAWGEGEAQIKAAKALVRADDEAETLLRAIELLHKADVDAVGAVRVSDEAVAGWAAWNGSGPATLSLSVGDEEMRFDIAADDTHPLSGAAFSHVAGFRAPRAQSKGDLTVALMLGDTRFLASRHAPNMSNRMAPRAHAGARLRSAGLVVVVPVYRDLRATRACLESLEPEIAGRIGRRVILVNDATPEPELAKLLQRYAKKPAFTLITNDVNLGFVGAVNRALGQVAWDDVVLLNADAVLPPGCLDRMAEVAEADPRIGTVTPLSNNGEFTSFPVPFEQNPLPSFSEIAALDRAAAAVNRGRVVDLPNGIGFCMLVTRRCLDVVGFLSDAYQRGYLEDVDFCLRAREHGFRNVCAASVFVGHHGSRSFGGDKRALVVRNIAVAEAKFPDYRQECALFMKADPLRPAREALERRAMRHAACDRLLVFGGGAAEEIAQARGAALRAGKKTSLLLRIDREPAGATVTLRDAAGAAPQSLRFDLGGRGARDDLESFLHTLTIGRIEIMQPQAVPASLLDVLRGLDVKMEAHVVDAGLACPRGTLVQTNGEFCAGFGKGDVCAGCVPLCSVSLQQLNDWRAAQRLLTQTRAVADGDEAGAFVRVLASGALPPGRPLRVKAKRAGATQGGRIGLVVQGRSTDEFRLMQDLLRRAVRTNPAQAFVVIGATLDDLGLMASGNVFVSGAHDHEDMASAFGRYGIDRVFLPSRRPLFGHPAFAAVRASRLPMAYFDWSFGTQRSRRNDLPIDPRCDAAEVYKQFGGWGGFDA